MISATANYQTALAAFAAGNIPIMITISGYSRVFTNYPTGVGGQYDWITSIEDFAYTVHDMDGGADQGTLTFSVQDVGAAITGDFPGFVFEGKLITLKAGFVGLAQVDWITLFTGYVDSVASANSNNEYTFSCSDISSRLAQVIYTIGDDGLTATDTNNVKTILAHPLDILLDILNNKIGLPAGNVDSAKIINYRDNIFGGMQFQFKLSQAPAAADFIKSQLLKPLGGYLWVNSVGKVTVNFFYPLAAPAAVATLNADVFTAIPEAEQVDMVNTIQFQFDKDDSAGGSGNYLGQDTEVYGPSVAKYGQYGELVVQSDGMRSNFQGFFVAKLVSRMIFYRYGLKNLKFDQNAPPCIWQAIRLEPGDIVAVTHSKVPDRAAGVMGITGKLFEILDRHVSFTEGIVTLTMIDANYLSTFGTYQIAPTGHVAYAASSAPDKALYMFMCSDADLYSNSDPAHALG
jgi:hypothetical protein